MRKRLGTLLIIVILIICFMPIEVFGYAGQYIPAGNQGASWLDPSGLENNKIHIQSKKIALEDLKQCIGIELNYLGADKDAVDYNQLFSGIDNEKKSTNLTYNADLEIFSTDPNKCIGERVESGLRWIPPGASKGSNETQIYYLDVRRSGTSTYTIQDYQDFLNSINIKVTNENVQEILSKNGIDDIASYDEISATWKFEMQMTIYVWKNGNKYSFSIDVEKGTCLSGYVNKKGIDINAQEGAAKSGDAPSNESHNVEVEAERQKEEESKTDKLSGPRFINSINGSGTSAQNPVRDPDAYKPSEDMGNTSEIQKVGITLLKAVRTLGIIFAVIALMIYGVRYMFGSLEEKAEYKETMIPWVVGSLLLVIGTTIIQYIYTIASQI